MRFEQNGRKQPRPREPLKFNRRTVLAVLGVLIASLCVGLVAREVVRWVREQHSVGDRVKQYGAAVHARLDPDFARVGVAWPPEEIVLLGLKQEKLLEVWVKGDGAYKLLKKYPILAASGKLGPKLQLGDYQVPEGIYACESLNPNSLYHLALRVGYPNAFDKAQAAKEGRTRLGGDIMIHGNNGSVGCLAMGDEAAEDLFVLAAETGRKNVKIVISPVDFRVRELPADVTDLPAWTGELYGQIREELAPLKPSVMRVSLREHERPALPDAGTPKNPATTKVPQAESIKR